MCAVSSPQPRGASSSSQGHQFPGGFCDLPQCLYQFTSQRLSTSSIQTAVLGTGSLLYLIKQRFCLSWPTACEAQRLSPSASCTCPGAVWQVLQEDHFLLCYKPLASSPVSEPTLFRTQGQSPSGHILRFSGHRNSDALSPFQPGEEEIAL